MFEKLYKEILTAKQGVKILVQTYFGDVRDCYNNILALDFDGVGLDFTEGKKTVEIIEKNGFRIVLLNYTKPRNQMQFFIGKRFSFFILKERTLFFHRNNYRFF